MGEVPTEETIDMALVYEQCGNCRRRGAYVVAARGIVRCKYCAAAEECNSLDPTNLGAVAAGLHAADDNLRGSARGSSGKTKLQPGDETRISGGVMSMDMATISVLAGGAKRHRSSFPSVQAAQAAPAVLPRGESHGLRAVVVDDDPTLRTIVAATLKRGGMTVTQAGSGEEGCAAILANPPDIALLDLCMPGMDGLEVLVELRRRCDTGIIVLSGRSNDGDHVIAMELGADDFVDKPFVPADLMARVVAVIASRTPRPATISAG